jgi:hypothetical protein
MSTANLLERISLQGKHKTCWFHSILNGFLVTDPGRKVLSLLLKSYEATNKGKNITGINHIVNAPSCPKEFSIHYFFSVVKLILDYPTQIRNVAGNFLPKTIYEKVRNTNVVTGKDTIHAFRTFLRRTRLIDHTIYNDVRRKEIRTCLLTPYLFYKYNLSDFTQQQGFAKFYMFKGVKYSLNNVYMRLTSTTNKNLGHAITGIISKGKEYVLDSNGKIYKFKFTGNPSSILNNIGPNVYRKYNHLKVLGAVFIRDDINSIAPEITNKRNYSAVKRRNNIKHSNSVKIKPHSAQMVRPKVSIKQRAGSAKPQSVPNKVISFNTALKNAWRRVRRSTRPPT